MEIIYNQAVLMHNASDTVAEGSYRLNGIEKIAKNVIPSFDVMPYIRVVHTEDYIQKVENACKSRLRMSEVNTGPETFDAAILSVAVSILAAKENNFAAIRPPGHHAEREFAKGFCFFNNIAIATQSLIDSGERICIIDIDGHKGDGTEEMFYKSDRVLFCSINQENSFPFRFSNNLDYESDKLARYTININIPEGSGDDILLKSLGMISPRVHKFNPSLIGISAGFDGYYKDNLLRLNYTFSGYYESGKIIREMGYPVFAVLEGGYHHDVLNCIESFVAGINGEFSEFRSPLSESSKDTFFKFWKNTSNFRSW